MSFDRVLEQIRDALADLPDTLEEWRDTPEDQQVDTHIWWSELIVGKLRKVNVAALTSSQSAAYDQLIIDLEAARPLLREIGYKDIADEIRRLAPTRIPA